MSNNTPKNLGGHRTKGDLSEQGAKSRANTIIRIKETWGVSELIDIFPKQIRPADELGSTAITNLRTISNLCPVLKEAQNGMLSVCRNPDGSYKLFSWSQGKALVEQLRESKNTSSAGGKQSNKKKGSAADASTPKTPAAYGSSAAPSSSPVKPKKIKAQAAGQELLSSIGKASVERTAATPTAAAAPAAPADDNDDDDDEGDSIVVDTAPRHKSAKKAKGLATQEKHGQTPTLMPPAIVPVAVMSTSKSQGPTMAATAPVAPMSDDGSQASGMATTIPVAVMSTDDSQAPIVKLKPVKKPLLNVAGNDSDSEDDDAEDAALPANIIDQLNGIAAPTNTTGKPAGKHPGNQVAAGTVGRMVIPSKAILHPFKNKPQKRLEQGESSKPPAVDKPVKIKKPFANLMTTDPKPKTFEPPKRRIQKAGDMKKDIEMKTQTESGVQDVDYNKETQRGSGIPPTEVNKEAECDAIVSAAGGNKGTQRDAATLATEVIKAAVAMEDVQVEAAAPIVLPTRTQLPTSPMKRTASTMLRAADEPNPQVERSTRARVDKRRAPYSERAVADAIQFGRVITSFTEAAMDAIDAYNHDGKDKTAEGIKMKYQAILTAVIDLKEGVADLAEKERVAGLAEREEK